MYWRQLSFYRNSLFILTALGLVIFITYRLAGSAKYETKNVFQAEQADVNEIDGLRFTPRGLALSFPFAKNENVDLTCFSTHQRDRLVRSSLFDEVHIQLLTQKLAWFTRPEYRSTLAALWRPSILIAQGKLTI